ncbi:MAG: hypothetical protein AB7U29_06390 [Desulfobulbus sp.]
MDLQSVVGEHSEEARPWDGWVHSNVIFEVASGHDPILDGHYGNDGPSNAYYVANEIAAALPSAHFFPGYNTTDNHRNNSNIRGRDSRVDCTN